MLDHWYNKYALIILGGVVAFTGYEWINWSSLTASDWGTWIGAIGTVGALAGTIWISTAQTRQAMTQARLHAAGFMLRLATTQGALGRIRDSLAIDEVLDRGEAAITSCIYDLDNIDLWTVGDLIPMTPLSPRVIGQLAESADQIKTAIKLLELARTDNTIDTPERRRGFARRLNRMLTGVIRLLEEGISLCDDARRDLHMSTR